MASQINNGTFTFNQEELQDLSEVIHELIYNNEDLRRIHDVETGVIWNRQIVFAGNIGLMGKTVSGCTPNAISGVTMTEKTWTPVKEDFRLEHCNADVNDQDKLLQRFARMNPDFYDVIDGSSSAIGQFLIMKVLEGFVENLLRKVWFNDTAAATIANSGVITDGTDVGFFNSFDGLFKQIMTNIPAGNALHVNIAKNEQTTYAAQALASTEGMAILRSMYDAADTRLKGLGDARFLVTQTIWDAYLNDLETIQNTGAGNTLINENGQVTLRYRGLEVIAMNTWDRNINAYQNSTTAWNLPHRAVLTIPSNIPIATTAESDFGDVDAFFDRTTKQNIIDGVYTIDAKHLENYLTVAAY